MRIFGVINVLSESRRHVNVLATLRKLLSFVDEDDPNHQLPNIPGIGKFHIHLLTINYLFHIKRIY